MAGGAAGQEPEGGMTVPSSRQYALKALYCRRHTVLQHLQWPQIGKNHAAACPVVQWSVARLKRVMARIFFMALGFFPEAWGERFRRPPAGGRPPVFHQTISFRRQPRHGMTL